MPLGFHLHGINHIALSLHMLDVGAFCLLVKASKDAGEVHDVPAQRVFFIIGGGSLTSIQTDLPSLLSSGFVR